MTFHSASSISQTRALLVCVMNGPLRPRVACSSQKHLLERNGAALIEKWETAELPLVFVESSLCLQDAEPRFETASAVSEIGLSRDGPTYLTDPHVRPRPGDLVFHSGPPSLLQHRQFTRLFEDLGGPLLILMGDDLEGTILETTIDGFVSKHPIVVVTDAAPIGTSKHDLDLPVRAKAIPLLSCFARVMQTAELLNEWEMS